MNRYKEHLKHKESTGQSAKSFEFFDDMDIELGDRPDIKPVFIMGSDMQRNGVRVKIESKFRPTNDENDNPAIGVGPPKKKKKLVAAKPDPISDMKKTLDDFIGHCKRNDEQKNAFMERYLDMYAKANNIDK